MQDVQENDEAVRKASLQCYARLDGLGILAADRQSDIGGSLYKGLMEDVVDHVDAPSAMDTAASDGSPKIAVRTLDSALLTTPTDRYSHVVTTYMGSNISLYKAQLEGEEEGEKDELLCPTETQNHYEDFDSSPIPTFFESLASSETESKSSTPERIARLLYHPAFSEPIVQHDDRNDEDEVSSVADDTNESEANVTQDADDFENVSDRDRCHFASVRRVLFPDDKRSLGEGVDEIAVEPCLEEEEERHFFWLPNQLVDENYEKDSALRLAEDETFQEAFAEEPTHRSR